MILNTGQIEIQNDGALHQALVDLFSGKYWTKTPEGVRKNHRLTFLKVRSAINHYIPKVVIETGTYLGTGTTLQVIDAAIAAEKIIGIKPRVYTIEASEKNCNTARVNLMKFNDWVKVMHGSSLDRDECVEFIKNDEAIKNHTNWPEFFIDCEDPVPFYEKEVDGQLFGKGRRGKNNILSELIPRFYKRKPLFVLDSAGGIGYLEFQKVEKMMQGCGYFVLLDDINHLKHFRSAAYIRHCEWPILAEDKKRWMLAYRKGTGGRPSFSNMNTENSK